ncbi:unnamed protein product [Psylliodes chrysocephalus]|uniref:Multidrug resistance-associated protein 4-like n=1 Tax=Psylliodes chrysocephalus TaxID=3402493 RepID=A0A9P0G3P3_9CUCU|nr:unnamed protein product [Psylliodes chrysocephala]
MDSSKKHVKPSPEEHANIFSKLFYWWFLPFFNFGYKNDVQFKDIYNVSQNDLSQVWGDKLQKNWEVELLKKHPSLKRAISNTFLKQYLCPGIGLCIQYNVIKMVLPVALARYINYFDKGKSEQVGWFWATVVVSLVFIMVIINHSSVLYTQRICMRARIAVCSVIYRKLLKLNHSSLGQTAAGKLVNLLSNDVQRFDMASYYLHFIWFLPFNAVISFYVIYCNVGLYATAAGMTTVLGFVPILIYMTTLQGKLRYQIAIRTDKRIKLMNEVTSGIQVIKMYAWEKPFEKMVEFCRKSEVSFIAKTSYVNGVLSAMGAFIEKLSLYVTVVTFALAGNPIFGDMVFSMAQLFNTFTYVMCIHFPKGLTFYNEAKVSIGRIEKFLLLDETEMQSITNSTTNSKEPNIDHITRLDETNYEEGLKKDTGDIELHHVTASWMPNSIAPTLVNVNLHVQSGTLCCVVGNVGAGKSSLLQLLLKRITVTSGKMSVNGTIAYASQEPWLFVSNVRDNILFGKPYNRYKYRQIVRVCSLEKDFKQFPFGDKSLVSERGTSLSGGQRARVNLARAVYSEADIYLLDDPLSAVDTKVAKRLFDVCIKDYLSGKTRILVTHQLQFIKDADLIVIINNGKIAKVGNFNDMTEKDLKLIQQQAEKEEKHEKNKKMEIAPSDNLTLQSVNSLVSVAGDEPEETDELIEKGNISSDTYIDYWRAGGSILFLLITISIFISAQVVINSADLWMTYWVNNEVKLSQSNSNGTNSPILGKNASDTELPSNLPLPETSAATLHEISTTKIAMNLLNSTINHSTMFGKSIDEIKPREYYIHMYTAFVVSSVILMTIRSFLFYYICMTASKVLHSRLFNNVLQAPMRFFDTNSSGRILNRFSKDIGAIDEILPRAQFDTARIFLIVFGVLTTVFIVTPWMMVPTIVLGSIFYWFTIIYLKCSQAIKRLEGTSKAPMFSHVSATLNGMSTIRSASAEQILIREFDVLQDQHTSTWFLFIASSTAFGFYFDVISTIFLALVTYQFLIFEDENTLSGHVGLVISQILILTGLVQYGVRQGTDVASNMVSVERVMQYTKLEKEHPLETGQKPPREWPSKGKIHFKNTYLSYAPELSPVLKDLNIEIGSAEKIGIVGRTGAGKSTLINSLFRLAPIDGSISIDDFNTALLGLRDLRSNISIIPQEPVLFSALLRYNLDPFEKHNDSVLWEALEHVELKEALPDLNMTISEGGLNLSAGQRQLICLARAIVKNNKILVMDEATANVDPQTDSLIQRTIRERFKDCTVLTVAHRLNTIMDNDRVLVMDAGQVMEFDHPYYLLQNSESFLSKMVNETGPEMAYKLKQIAKNSYLYKNKISSEDGTFGHRD